MIYLENFAFAKAGLSAIFRPHGLTMSYSHATYRRGGRT